MKAIDRLRAPDPSGKQVLHWDTELRGFGVLCSGVTNARSYIVQRDLRGGRTRRMTLGAVNVLPLDQARERARVVLAEFYNGKDPKAGRTAAKATLRQTLAEYLSARKSLREKSRRAYESALKHLADWADSPISDISPEEIEARHRAIASAIASEGRYVGEATANGVMRALRLLYNFAAERDPSLPPNPVRRLKRQWFHVPRREGLVRAQDLAKFYAAVTALPNPVARDYLLLLLFTGLRRGEAASLTWDDVDLTSRIIRLPATRTKSGRKLDLPMTTIVYDMLVARRKIGDAGWVLPSNSRGGAIAEPKFPLSQVALASGVRVSAHDLRRTYITVAESADISPLALKALVNHSLGGNDVTSGYIMMTAERLRAPAQKVADRIKQLCGITDVAGQKSQDGGGSIN